MRLLAPGAQPVYRLFMDNGLHASGVLCKADYWVSVCFFGVTRPKTCKKNKKCWKTQRL